MHIPNSFGLALLALSDSATALRKPADSVLLSSVKTLTLRDGKETSHRRVSAVPQLKCVGGNARDLYSVDVMRCKNSGSDYDDDNVQWTCQASLPEEFKLGSTDVICEGYDSASDPYVLKGSCGVEYRLVLTDKGEVKYGRLGDNAAGTPRQEMFQDLGFWLCLTCTWFVHFARRSRVLTLSQSLLVSLDMQYGRCARVGMEGSRGLRGGVEGVATATMMVSAQAAARHGLCPKHLLPL